MTNTKKDQRWAILPPKEPVPDDRTRTQRRARQSDGEAQQGAAAQESGSAQSDDAQSGSEAPDESRDGGAVSRRRARTEPELLGLEKLVSQVAQPIATPRPPAFEPLVKSRLGFPDRDAVTAPPEASTTLLSPPSDPNPAPVPTLIDRLEPSDGEFEEPIIVERSRVGSASGVRPSAGAVPGENGETLPSPPWRDDDG